MSVTSKICTKCCVMPGTGKIGIECYCVMSVTGTIGTECYCVMSVTGWLVDLIFNVPVNNFSVMLGRSQGFLGIISTFGELMCPAQGHNTV